MKIDKKPIQKSQKMKSKVIVLIFGESLNYKSGLGFFFWHPNMATFAKSAQVGASKKNTKVQKIQDHFYKANFP